ncbi:MAG: amidohydrolase family protein [Candidatus Thorarchaeota archaeon]|jgi:hypothetical protein
MNKVFNEYNLGGKKVFSLEKEFTYSGPIYDAHSHVIDVEIGSKYGIEKALLIVHGTSIKEYEERYPERFIFAKYFSGWLLFSEQADTVIQDAKNMLDQGYGMAKMHFAPFWTDRMAEIPEMPALDSERFDEAFDIFAEQDIPVLIHVADPDTYFASRYTETNVYGTKEQHLGELENRLEKNPRNRFQIAHFAAQPEQHRLDNLGRLFDKFPNLNVDTGSARWMVRELGKNPENSRKFLMNYADRILFATDCVARTLERGYYEGRHSAERLLLESNIRNVPLPFDDKDTVNSGGTYINGLSLPQSVLEKIYWKNAINLHQFD